MAAPFLLWGVAVAVAYGFTINQLEKARPMLASRFFVQAGDLVCTLVCSPNPPPKLAARSQQLTHPNRKQTMHRCGRAETQHHDQ